MVRVSATITLHMGTFGPGELPPELVSELDRYTLRAVIEYVCARVGADRGSRKLSFWLTGGSLRQASIDHGPIRNAELESIASR